jgi:putative NADH-flavin reductase
MRLTAFGGTSPTGGHLIQQAPQTGHTVTALARDPAKLATRDGLTVIEGQLTDTQAVARAVKDAEAVISLLGPPSKQVLGRVDVAPILDGYRTIVAAMETHGDRRLVALGTPSITDPADRREHAFSMLVAVGKRIKPAAYRTMVGIGQIVRASDLDWTIVRVPLLTDGPRTERINVRTVGDKGGIRLSRANAAAYFLQQADDTTRVGQATLITDT